MVGTVAQRKPKPWHTRVAKQSTKPHKLPPALRPFFSRYFAWKVIFALRVSCIAILVPTILITDSDTTQGFLSKTLVILVGLLGSREWLGSSVLILFEFFKSIWFTWPLATIYVAAGLYKNAYAWSVMYVASFTIASFLYDGIAKKTALLLFNVTMVAQLRAYYDGKGPGLLLTFPTRVMGEFVVGWFLGMCCTILPSPKLAFRRAEGKIKEAGGYIGSAFAGVCDSFWAPSNLQRRVNIVHIRAELKKALSCLEDASVCMAVSHLEPQTADMYFHRVAKFRFVSGLPALVESSLRVLEALTEDPYVIHNNRQADAFANALRSPLADLSEAVEAALQFVVGSGHAQVILFGLKSDHCPDAAEDHPHIPLQPLARLEKSLSRFQHCYARARRDIYYSAATNIHAITDPQSTGVFDCSPDEHEALPATLMMHQSPVGSHDSDDTTEFDISPMAQEFGALMAFYVFTLTLLSKRTLGFPAAAAKERAGKSVLGGIHAEIWGSVKSTLYGFPQLFMCLLPPSSPPAVWLARVFAVTPEQSHLAVLKLREGLKFGISMGLSLLFYYYTDRQYAFLQGPQILCFGASTSISEAFLGAFMRLFGNLLGGIIGFFFAHVTNTPVQKVATMTTIMFVFNFFRSGKKYGGVTFYACVVLVPMLGASMSNAEATSRITQFTFAGIIYFIITVLVFPTRPIAALTHARLQALAQLPSAFATLASAFTSIGEGSRADTEAATSSLDMSMSERPTEGQQPKDDGEDSSSSSSDSEADEGAAAGDHANGGDPRESPYTETPPRKKPSVHPFGLCTPQPAGAELGGTLVRREITSTTIETHEHSATIRRVVTKNSSFAAPSAVTFPPAGFMTAATKVTPTEVAASKQPETSFPALAKAEGAFKLFSALVGKSAAWMPMAEIEPSLTRTPFPAHASSAYHQTIIKIRSLLELMLEGLRLLNNTTTNEHSPYFLLALHDLEPAMMACVEAFTTVAELMAVKMALGESFEGFRICGTRIFSNMIGISIVDDDEDCVNDAKRLEDDDEEEDINGAVVAALLHFEDSCMALHNAKAATIRQLVRIARLVHAGRGRGRCPFTGESPVSKGYLHTFPHHAGPPEVLPPLGGRRRSKLFSGRVIVDDPSSVTHETLLSNSAPDAPVEVPSPSARRPMALWTAEELAAAADTILSSAKEGLKDGRQTPHHSRHSGKLKMLMTNNGAEGLHTFSFCLVLLSGEIKTLLMAVEALQDHATLRE